ncbi:MAG: sodium/proton-translocating pyrophosphatase, partial [Clostridiales Family XIII bacterium]|nr:sodium/proton-translocating pyrophosphatase [Clostridiales Family XIII bacterium]
MSDAILNVFTYLVPAVAVVGLLIALFLAAWVKKRPEGSDRMKEVSGFIRAGAMAFLKREYRYMAVVIVVITVLLGFAINWATGGLYVFGALFSILAGFFGMKVATWGNVRTANAALEHGLPAALKVAFRSGAVMGICVSGLGLLGLGLIFALIGVPSYEIVTGFSLGASSMALFGRVGGGIYTKAADVGADLVGKVEAGIPEDDPRNPAVIADNVGDNVGDVAGMGSDLFESYVGSIVSALALAAIIPSIQ